MPRRQVLVQLDDDLVAQLDALSAREGVSRSDLLRRGGWAVIHAASVHEADEQLRAAYRARPQDEAIVRSARRLAARTAPEW